MKNHNSVCFLSQTRTCKSDCKAYYRENDTCHFVEAASKIPDFLSAIKTAVYDVSGAVSTLNVK